MRNEICANQIKWCNSFHIINCGNHKNTHTCTHVHLCQSGYLSVTQYLPVRWKLLSKNIASNWQYCLLHSRIQAEKKRSASNSTTTLSSSLLYYFFFFISFFPLKVLLIFLNIYHNRMLNLYRNCTEILCLISLRFFHLLFCGIFPFSLSLSLSIFFSISFLLSQSIHFNR